MIAVIILPLEVVCAGLLWRQWHKLAQTQAQMRCAQVRLAEISRLADSRSRLRQSQKNFEHAVDSTTDTVETVHRALADLSFDLWGRGHPKARERHHEYTKQVYGGVRQANRLLGGLASKWLDKGKSRDE